MPGNKTQKQSISNGCSRKNNCSNRISQQIYFEINRLCAFSGQYQPSFPAGLKTVLNRKKQRKKSFHGTNSFQHFNLFPHKTVIENIMMVPVLLKKMNKEQARQKAMELLNRVGLLEKADVYPAMLSGGQKQRLLLLFQKNMVLN